MEKILISELKELNEVNIIDVRKEEDYEKGYILNAINIPKNLLMSNPDKYLDKGTKYYIYCDIGLLSREICNSLDRDYDLVNLVGGYKKWIETNK